MQSKTWHSKAMQSKTMQSTAEHTGTHRHPQAHTGTHRHCRIVGRLSSGSATLWNINTFQIMFQLFCANWFFKTPRATLCLPFLLHFIFKNVMDESVFDKIHHFSVFGCKNITQHGSGCALTVKAMERDFLESPQREIYFYPQAKQAPLIWAIHIQAAPFEVQLIYWSTSENPGSKHTAFRSLTDKYNMLFKLSYLLK